eukprot:768262-Hanusia_phi.AAC.4
MSCRQGILAGPSASKTQNHSEQQTAHGQKREPVLDLGRRIAAVGVGFGRSVEKLISSDYTPIVSGMKEVTAKASSEIRQAFAEGLSAELQSTAGGLQANAVNEHGASQQDSTTSSISLPPPPPPPPLQDPSEALQQNLVPPPLPPQPPSQLPTSEAAEMSVPLFQPPPPPPLVGDLHQFTLPPPPPPPAVCFTSDFQHTNMAPAEPSPPTPSSDGRGTEQGVMNQVETSQETTHIQEGEDGPPPPYNPDHFNLPPPPPPPPPLPSIPSPSPHSM